MSTPPPPRLKSHTRTPDGPGVAERPRYLRTVGASKVVGPWAVPSGSEPHPANGPRIVGMLHISAPGRRAVPTATSRCECGRNRSTVGQHQVLALVDDHIAHRDLCPLLNPTEGRDAA
ncbi:hypothetical protein ACFYV5_16290 [Streptomyces sp. NPDC003035]|uniref:hypothetical protein n=1 Tax=Streptomyces sp. NPDC003035 TaxID=3364676 RepID=UPI0036AF451A